MSKTPQVGSDDDGPGLVEYALFGPALVLVAVYLSFSGIPSSFSRIFEHLDPDPIASFVRDRMKPASGAFFVPSPLEREEPSEVVLEISPPTITPEQLESELRAAARHDGVSASESIKIAPRMKANLVADRKCTITAVDELDRAVAFGELVKWRWKVTPESGNNLTLTATLTAPVIVDGKETGYTVTSFEKTVTVNVTGRQRAVDLLNSAKDYWLLLAAAGAGLLAAFEWMRRRRKRRAGFETFR